MEPDLEAMDEGIIERYWQQYLAWCKENKQKPKMKGFFIYYEENYV